MAQHASYINGNEYFPSDMMQRENDWITPGVVSLSDLIVTPSTPLSLTVNVSGASQGSIGGNAWLPNGYRFYNDSQQTVTLATADLTNPRIDLIVAGIDTTQNPYLPTIKVITGTPSSTPVALSIPTTLQAITLYQISVPANATTITSSQITDVRTMAVIKNANLAFMFPQNTSINLDGMTIGNFTLTQISVILGTVTLA